ncbi:uncharacterized protein LOC110374265 [Helicoverpa armigera]|uniref:uncharacterized protein LOC110374265 n=1 Tax=Helicoverpa armigera TaxID=29058 RepID=UPI003083BB42
MYEDCSIPGTFFWKPRLGLDLAVPTTEFKMNVNLRTRENIEEGLVVLIDGYQMGLSVISIASGASNMNAQTPHFDPTSAAFTTNFYRWALRYFSSIPYWIGGKGGNFCDTLKLWRRRFYYMDEQVPSWLRTLLFYIKKEDWEREDLDLKRFKKYSESAFGRHFRNPSKNFNNFKSQETVETMEQKQHSSSLIL